MNTRRTSLLFIISLSLASLFFLHNTRAASSGEVVLNEVAWMGTTISSSDEWIELKNTTGVDIDLTGWTLASQDGTPNITLTGSLVANGYFILERTNDDSAAGVVADQIYTGSLLNSGEFLELRDSDGVLIDSIDASGGWPAGDNTNKYTMERITNGWQNSTAVNGTPRAINSGSSPSEPEPNPEAVATTPEVIADVIIETIEVAGEQQSFGDVVINEFVADPADGEVEFIELYNTTGVEISLDGWVVTEGSEAETTLSGSLGISGSSRFFIIEKPKGNLNNSGDIITLKQNEVIIDQVAYGNWDDGNIDNNAPSVSDPLSIARRVDGSNSFNNKNDFVETSTITKGSSNIIVSADNESSLTEQNTSYDYSRDVVISEFLPNPEGLDNEAEFIELFNKGNKSVNVEGWSLSDSGKRKYELTSSKLDTTIILPNDYLVIYRSVSKIALNNAGGDEVRLWQPAKDKPLQVVPYTKAVENWSYNLEVSNSWAWSEAITPGAANNITAINHAPSADFDFVKNTSNPSEVNFDSSDSVDEDNDVLKFVWDFGDGMTNKLINPTHIFNKTGIYEVSLVVSDGELTDEIKKTVEVNTTGLVQDNVLDNAESDIIISEFLPNPEGLDSEGEWIELYNKGQQSTSLLNWQLDDQEGGSRPFTIEDNIILTSGQYYVFDRADTGLALNNTVDSVRLFDSSGNLVDSVDYAGVSEGASYVRNGDKWQWSVDVTPAEQNSIVATTPKSSSRSTTRTSNSVSKYRAVVVTTLEKIREFDKGDFVKVNGTVAVLPGVFSTQYFYIVGSPGVQVYSSKKLFPQLRVGDIIAVTGELSSIQGELRLKTKVATDIEKISTSTPPEPVITETDKIGEDMEAQLVRLQGEVVEKKGSTIWIDDGSSEIEVYIKRGTKITKSRINEGDFITVIGIVTQNGDSYRILPRSQDDIFSFDSNIKGEVLGVTSENTEWALAQNNKKLKLMKYLLITAIALILVLVELVIRNKKARGTQ